MARPDDAAQLIAIEADAALLFAAHGHPQIATAPPTALDAYHELMLGREALAAVDPDDSPIGVALCERLGATWWLCELSVRRAHGRRGIGAALLEAAIALGRARGCVQAGLSTFRDVPFNAPFYVRHGFAEVAVEAAEPALRARFAAEIPPGTDAAERVLMLRRL